MLTWAYAWFASRPGIREYMPILFIGAMVGDVMLITEVAKAIGRVCK